MFCLYPDRCAHSVPWSLVIVICCMARRSAMTKPAAGAPNSSCTLQRRTVSLSCWLGFGQRPILTHSSGGPFCATALRLLRQALGERRRVRHDESSLYWSLLSCPGLAYEHTGRGKSVHYADTCANQISYPVLCGDILIYLLLYSVPGLDRATLADDGHRLCDLLTAKVSYRPWQDNHLQIAPSVSM